MWKAFQASVLLDESTVESVEGGGEGEEEEVASINAASNLFPSATSSEKSKSESWY